MFAPTLTSPSTLAALANAHPEADRTLTAEAAFLTLGPVTYYALLGESS